MFWKRILVAIICIPLILFAGYRGGYLLLGLLSIFSCLGLYELREMFRRKYGLIPLVVIPLGVIFLWLTSLFALPAIGMSLLLLLIVVGGYDIFFNRIEGSSTRLVLSSFAVIYQVFLYSLVFRIRGLENGKYLLLSVIILIWLTDTFAYFMGMLFGKHRGVFKASPRKSVEGFIFGIIFAFIGAYVLFIVFAGRVPMKVMFLAAFSAGIFGQFGDLLESLIKRDVEVKDSSGIIPGHGGILDRFDSFIIAAPAFYILYTLFM